MQERYFQLSLLYGAVCIQAVISDDERSERPFIDKEPSASDVPKMSAWFLFQENTQYSSISVLLTHQDQPNHLFSSQFHLPKAEKSDRY